jgi:hypothetical protein
MKLVTSVWLIVWTLAGCSAQAPDQDDGEIPAAESESLCVKNALTPAQEQAALKAIDDICGDTWCEGDNDFAFHELHCSAPRGNRSGTCKLELRIIPLEGARGYPHTFERHCTTGDFSGFDSLVVTAPNGYQSLNPAYYAALTECIARLEDALPH